MAPHRLHHWVRGAARPGALSYPARVRRAEPCAPSISTNPSALRFVSHERQHLRHAARCLAFIADVLDRSRAGVPSGEARQPSAWSLWISYRRIRRSAHPERRHKCVVPTVPCLRHKPRTIVACSMGSVASDKSFFCRTGSTSSKTVTFSLYECSTANSRREFRTMTRKSSSESDDEDALRSARGSSER